jgi:hypothetical protein
MAYARFRGFALVTELLALLAAGPLVVKQAKASASNLVILKETGRTRENMPVLQIDRDSAAVAEVMSRGFSGRLLRLYQWEQEYLRRAANSTPEPIYLLLSGQRGGFPRFGFYLDEEEKRGVGYVDLHKTSPLKGRFGSMDQIFPHELVHVIVRQLAGNGGAGGSNQIHAVGVRTDPNEAFSEGFAEHVQIMAIDDPDADPATRALATNEEFRKMAVSQAKRYLSELQANFAPFGPMRMGFLVWFSGTEQVWRYFAVKAEPSFIIGWRQSAGGAV